MHICRDVDDSPSQHENERRATAYVYSQCTPPPSAQTQEQAILDSTVNLADDCAKQEDRSLSGKELVGVQAWGGCVPQFTCECGICLDNKAGVEVFACGHTLCTGCALQLCLASSSTPSCPFCRCLMQGFRAATI